MARLSLKSNPNTLDASSKENFLLQKYRTKWLFRNIKIFLKKMYDVKDNRQYHYELDLILNLQKEVENMEQIPKLYETEPMSLEEKVIYQVYTLHSCKFFWMVAELNVDENLAFGFANLNDDSNAEWGYISISEIMDCGAILERDWTPCKFSEAMAKINEKRGS